MQADDRGFADVLTMTFPTAKAFEEERNRSANALGELLDRAKAAGKLRQDFAHLRTVTPRLYLCLLQMSLSQLGPQPTRTELPLPSGLGEKLC
ncbi:hypothetical protein [Arthrobacter sp. Z4-13]